MNINQLSEQLKDVPQNRLVDYAKNPNSVVPQFLALAEIQRRQQLSAQAAPPAATVAEDVLAQAQPAPAPMAPQQVDPRALQAQAMQQQAQQLPENQPGVAQLPTGMPQGMASGGIVAFAGGGLQDEEVETEDKELARLFGSNLSFDEVASAARGLMSKLPKSYEATKAAQEASTPKGNHKYEAAVLEEAKRQGVDPALALHVLYKETGNLKDPESARSKAGAIGIMQLMPKTAEGLGVNPMDPMDNIRGGITYLKQMYNKYQDPRMAAAAYNAGPGNVDKAMRRQGGLDTLSGETRNYIAGLAQGGSVKHFDGTEDSDVKDDSLKDNAYLKRSRGVVDLVKNAADALTTPSNYDVYKMYKENIGDPFAAGVKRFVNEPVESQAERFRAASMNPNKTPTVGYNVPAGSNIPVPSNPAMTLDEANRLANIAAANHAQKKEGVIPAPRTQVSTEQMGPPAEYGAITPAVEKSTEKTKAEMLMEEALASINERAAKAKESGDMNTYLALMQAGLGMMASKSPYALSGIGEGGQAGISTYAALRKQQADEEKDVLASRLGLAKYGLAAENADKELALKKAIYGGKEDQSAEALAERVRANDIKQREFDEANAVRTEKMLRDSLKNNYTMTEDQKEQWIQSHPLMKSAYKKVGIDIGGIAGPVQIKDKAEYDKLQPGQQYRDPQGQLRTKG